MEFVFTNTGNTDDDATIELPDQTLEGVYFYWQNRYAPNRSAGWMQNDAQGWGKWTMNDTVGDGHEDYNVDYRAQWSWLGHVPELSGRTALGGPLFSDNSWLVASGDSTGRLGAAHMLGRVILHADVSATDETNDPEQPRTMNVIWTGDPRTHLNEHTDLKPKWTLSTNSLLKVASIPIMLTLLNLVVHLIHQQATQLLDVKEVTDLRLVKDLDLIPLDLVKTSASYHRLKVLPVSVTQLL